MNPNVSIIIPVYNVEKHIVKCIESVMSQTIDHSIVECIIVNDCTPDNSMDIIGELTRDYQTNNGKMSFRIINHTENKGVSTSRNDGIDAATGDFVFFIDSDDYLYPECLQTLFEAHLKYSNADLIIGNAYNEILNTNEFDISKDRVVNNLNYLFQGTLAHYTVWNMLIRRDMLNKYDLRFKNNVSVSEDDLFNFQLQSMANQAVVISDITYFYKKNGNGQTMNFKYAKVVETLKGYISILSIYEQDLQGKCYVGKSFYVFNLANRALDFLNNARISIPDVEEQERILMQIIRKILIKHIVNIRPILFLMTLLLTKPFEWLIKMRLYRRYFNKICMIFWIPSMMRDYLSIQHKSEN